MIGYLALVVIAAAIRFPYKTDPVGERSIPRPADSDAFYAKIYSAPPAPTETGSALAEEEKKDDPYVLLARMMIEETRVVPRFKELVKKYNLENAHLLDVGSGTGYLQDLVEDYVGLDISPTAARFYHKPFIHASATEMPIADNEFDAAWTVWVLEHVPAPERALMEMRRVTKDGGLIVLEPAWDCGPWAAQGYFVRPFSDFDVKGKLIKASAYAVEYKPFSLAVKVASRLALGLRSWFVGPTSLHYGPLDANFDKYWMNDSDAINAIDRYETALWFTSRGDECLNCDDNLVNFDLNLIIRVHKR